MDNKPILYGVIGLFLGVAIATYTASTAVNTGNTGMMQMMGMSREAGSGSAGPNMMNGDKSGMMGMNSSMDQMMSSMIGKSGDDFDRAFISAMTVHHQGAIDMAKVAQANAKHEEIKMMARNIITAQTQEINQMNAWMKSWGY